MVIIKSLEFMKWFEKQSNKTKAIISARLDRIEIDGYFGFINVFDAIIELKWISGMRIYTFLYKPDQLVILLGGNKNGQNKDIKKAQKIRKNFIHYS